MRRALKAKDTQYFVAEHVLGSEIGTTFTTEELKKLMVQNFGWRDHTKYEYRIRSLMAALVIQGAVEKITERRKVHWVRTKIE